MISSIAVFVLVFAAMGLLLGFAASLGTHEARPPLPQTGTNSTSSNIDIQEQVNITVQKAQGS